MNRPKVVITHWIHDQVLRVLGKSCRVVPNPTRETLPRDEILRRCADADGVIVFMPDLVDEEFLDACQRLKVIAAALKGFDNIDVAACRRRGIAFTYATDLLTEPTAELAVALLLSLGRSVLSGDRLVRSGSFDGWRPILYGKGLSGSTVGILGMGAIGRGIAERLAGFRCRLICHDPALTPLTGTASRATVRNVTFQRVLEESDFLVLAAPLNAGTYRLIDEEALSRMKRGGYLVNVGRGSVVDEEAVAAALRSGRLAGYAADVFAFEDRALPNRPAGIPETLLSMPDRTLFTPHLGSAVDAIRRDIAMEAARSVLAVLAPPDSWASDHLPDPSHAGTVRLHGGDEMSDGDHGA